MLTKVIQLSFLTHGWTTDVNQPVNYILIHIYTGTTTPNSSIAAKNITGSFTIIESVRFDPFDVTNFNDFILSNDCTNIQSSNDSSYVFFSFDGSTDELNQREDYIFDFKVLGNYTEFDIYTMFNYTMIDLNDRLTFRVFVGSYFDFSGNYLGPVDYDNVGDYLIIGAGIWDAWEANTEDYIVIGYPYNVKERINSGTPDYFGNLAVHLKRNSSLILAQCIDIDTGNILLEHVWDGSAGWPPANFLLLDFYSEETVSTVTTCVFNITGKIGGELGYTLFDDIDSEIHDSPEIIFSTPENEAVIIGSEVLVKWVVITTGAYLDFCLIKLDNFSYINVGNLGQYLFSDLSAGWHVVEVIAYDDKGFSNNNNITFYIESASTSPPTITDSEYTVNIPGFTSLISITSLLLTTFFILKIKKNKHKSNKN
ncbi:MAG TPA: hypothetical protein VMX55_07265 [candidate division Zixibacteria bacterium]|nr:hypothetical protein [candidate division Zixibacteria bacterium]